MKTVKGRVILIGGAVLVIAAVILIILLSNSETTYRSISVSEVYGKVMTENNGKSYEAYKNMVIGGGYSLSTEAESYTRMVLDGDKYMKLEEESSASFESLGSPQNRRTAIRLNYGVLSTEITQPLTEDEDFIVNTPNAVLAVRGTFFRVEVSFDTNGDAYTDVYTYAGSIDCHRVMPDGTEVDEHVMINKGYKARIKMDEIITIYVEELIEEEKDDVDPLELRDVQDGQLVDVYNASAHGHEMFRTTKELWLEILERNIDLSKYTSAYDGGEIPAYTDEGVNTPEDEGSDSAEPVSTEEASKPEETSEPPPNTDEEQSGTLPFETTEPPPEGVPGNNGGHSGVPPDEAAELPPDGTAQPPPDETAEQPPQVTPGETEKPPPEVVAETTPPTTKPPDGTGDSAATDEVYDPTESTDEIYRPPESTDEIYDPPESTDVVTDPPETTATEGETPLDTDLIEINEVNFPDTVFRTYVSDNFDGDMDGYLSVGEREAVTSINVMGNSSSDGGVTSLKGVEHFTKLKMLYCSDNSGLTELDVSKNTALENLYCESTSISVLDISKNTALEVLKCFFTSISVLDVSNNTALRELNCGYTSISTLNVSNNTQLQELWCNDTLITELDISKNTALTRLTCPNTPITELDVSNNIALENLDCSDTSISTLDVSKNTALTDLYCGFCKLACIDISNNSGVINNYDGFSVYSNTYPITVIDGTFGTNTIPGFDPVRVSNVRNASWDASTGVLSNIVEGTTEITYTYDCDGVGRHNAKFTLKPDENSTYAFEPVTINDTNFPDAVFRQYVMDNFDMDSDGFLSESESETVTFINVCGSPSADGGVTSLTGVENFANLETLYCHYNSGITELDVSKNTALNSLYCNGTSISELDVSNNTALTRLNCSSTSISALDVSNNTALQELTCYRTSISALDVSNNTALQELICYNTSISALDVSNNTALEKLHCDNTQISELDVSKNTALTHLSCGNTQVSSLDVSKNTALKDLSCYNTSISTLDVSNNTALESLGCDNTQISELDVSKNTALKVLYCSGTSISELDVSKNTALTSLLCYGTSISELDVSNNTALTSLSCGDSNLACVDISNNSAIASFNANNNKHPITVTNGTFDTKTIPGFDPARVSNISGAVWDASTGILSNIVKGTTEITYTYDCDGVGGHNETFTLVPDENSTFAFEPVEINDTNFPNDVFRQYVVDGIETEGDGFLSEDECEAVTEIDVSGIFHTDGGVTSLTGIEHFTKLKILYCNYNSGLTELDISKNTALTYLSCHNTQISALDVSKNTALQELTCYNTSISELDVSKNTALKTLSCYETSISALDVSNNTALQELTCYNTSISALDVSNNTALEKLHCDNTQISELDVSKNTALTHLSCGNTQVSSLDVSKNTALTHLTCYNTSISELDVSKNTALTYLECDSNEISALNVSNNTALKILSCSNTSISALDVSKNTALNTLSCCETSISALDVSKNKALGQLNCWNANLAFIDISHNSSITTSAVARFDASRNKHPITVTNGTFDLKSIDGFDISRIVPDSLTGATMDENGVLSGITEGTSITYTYDCDGNGAGGRDMMFTLVANDTSTYVSNLSIDTLSLDDVSEGLTNIEANPNADVNVPSSDEEIPSDTASEENSENASEVAQEETEQKGEEIPEPPPDVNDPEKSETGEVLNETTGDEVPAETAGDEMLTESAGDENLTENTADNGGEDLTESTAESSAENLTETTVNDSAESGSEVITDLEPNFTPETVTQTLTDAA